MSDTEKSDTESPESPQRRKKLDPYGEEDLLSPENKNLLDYWDRQMSEHREIVEAMPDEVRTSMSKKVERIRAALKEHEDMQEKELQELREMELSDNKKRKPLITDPSLLHVLSMVFDDLDINSRTPHSVIKALHCGEIKSWENFIWAHDDAIDELMVPNRNKDTPLAKHSRNVLLDLKDLIHENIKNGESRAIDAQFYTRNKFHEHALQLNATRRSNLGQSTQASGTSSTKRNSGKSQGEREYDYWIKSSGKRSKESFDILKADELYITWKSKFDAEIASQNLTNLIDKDFNPPTDTDCPFERKLYKEQNTYFWTVLQRCFANPLGLSCLLPHLKDRDARAAYFEHERLQAESPARKFYSAIHLNQLQQLSLSGYKGTRVGFITTWFTKLHEFHEVLQANVDYQLVKVMLIAALDSEEAMTKPFLHLKDTGNDALDLDVMRNTIQAQASLLDGREAYLKPGSTRKAHVTDLQAHQGNNTPATSIDAEFLMNKSTQSRASEIRLPHDVYSVMTPQEREEWQGMSDGARMHIVKAIRNNQSPKPGNIQVNTTGMDQPDAASALTSPSHSVGY